MRIGDRAVEVAAWSVRLERHLLVVHDLFDEHDVPHRFVKGATVAHRFYATPGCGCRSTWTCSWSPPSSSGRWPC